MVLQYHSRASEPLGLKVSLLDFNGIKRVDSSWGGPPLHTADSFKKLPVSVLL